MKELKHEVVFGTDGCVDFVRTFMPYIGRGGDSAYGIDNLTQGQATEAFGPALLDMDYDNDELLELVKQYRVVPRLTLGQPIDNMPQLEIGSFHEGSSALIYQAVDMVAPLSDEAGRDRLFERADRLDLVRLAGFLPIYRFPWFDGPVFWEMDWGHLIVHVLEDDELSAAFDIGLPEEPGYIAMAETERTAMASRAVDESI